MLGYNSKVFYVVTDGGGNGERVDRIPFTGNETVLDAVASIQGLSDISSKRVWVARPSPPGCAGSQVMMVDWRGITQDGVTTTNYPDPSGRSRLHQGRRPDRAGQCVGQDHDAGRTRARRDSAGSRHLQSCVERGRRDIGHIVDAGHRILERVTTRAWKIDGLGCLFTEPSTNQWAGTLSFLVAGSIILAEPNRDAGDGALR